MCIVQQRVIPSTAATKLLHMTDRESNQYSRQSSSSPARKKHFNHIKRASKLWQMAPFFTAKEDGMVVPTRQMGALSPPAGPPTLAILLPACGRRVRSSHLHYHCFELQRLFMLMRNPRGLPALKKVLHKAFNHA